MAAPIDIRYETSYDLISNVDRSLHGTPHSPAAGHARPAHPQGIEPPAAARPRSLAPDRADHPRRLYGRRRLALSRAPPARGEGLARRHSWRIGEQSPGEVLPPDGRGPPAARRRNGGVGSRGGCHARRARVGMIARVITRLRSLWWN